MKSFTVTALGIAFKIWGFTVLINSLADTFLFGNFYGNLMGIFLLITLFAALFSAPVFFILWAIIYNHLHAYRPAGYILKFLLGTGVGLAIATWFVFAIMFNFFEMDMIGLAVATPLSAVFAILIHYATIKKACVARDDAKNLLENLGIEQPVA